MRAFSVIAFLFSILTSVSEAATIQSVSPDGTKLHVKLSREELAVMPWRGQILIEASDLKGTFVAPMSIHELAPTKSMVILTSQTPLTQVRRLMTVQFLPLFWDTINSRLLQSPSQLHSFKQLSAGGGSSLIFEALAQRRSDRERRRLSRAAMLRADTVIPISNDLVGLTLGADYLSASQDLTTATRSEGENDNRTVTQNTRIVKNTLRPGLWSNLGPDLRLGLHVEYMRVESVTKGNARKDLYLHELIEPQLGLTYFDTTFEGTILFKWGDKSTSKSSSPVIGVMTETISTLRTPAELWVTARFPTPRLGLWGAGIGYLFHTGESVFEDATMPHSKIPEFLRARISLEQRLNQGSKVQWLLQYDGGKTPGPWITERLANTLSLTGGYQQLWNDVWTIGGQIRLEFGTNNLNVEVQNEANKSVSRSDKVTSMGTEVVVYIQKAFQVGDGI